MEGGGLRVEGGGLRVEGGGWRVEGLGTGEDASGDVSASSDPTNGANTCFRVEDLGFGV